MDEGDKESARLGAQHVFQNAGFEIVFELVTSCALALLPHSGVTSSRRRAAGFLEFFIRGVRETQDRTLKGFIKIGPFGEQPQAGIFRCSRWRKQHFAVPDEHRSSHLALNRVRETDGTGAEPEGGGVALQFEVADRHSLATES